MGMPYASTLSSLQSTEVVGIPSPTSSRLLQVPSPYANVLYVMGERTNFSKINVFRYTFYDNETSEPVRAILV